MAEIPSEMRSTETSELSGGQSRRLSMRTGVRLADRSSVCGTGIRGFQEVTDRLLHEGITERLIELNLIRGNKQ